MSDFLATSDFEYQLPADRIAQYPLAERDHSKLLMYANGEISHQHFYDLPNLLPQNSRLYFNDTRVIPARILFTKSTGAEIELFLLDPVAPSRLVAETMTATHSCQWHCVIGNRKRWKPDSVLQKKSGALELTARWADASQDVIEFTWNLDLSFAAVIEQLGAVPLPPYLHREAEVSDRERYQTIYSRLGGAVAAPTAGLHFTEKTFRDLKSRGVEVDYLTLHVSAGTFQPIKTDNAIDHAMHGEQVIITRRNIEHLLESRQTIAVGTTAVRTLESIYWWGCRLAQEPNAPFQIDQYTAYRVPPLNRRQALEAVLKRLDEEKTDTWHGATSIYIYPGYTFRILQGLITNFHQPGSTLMLLIAAWVGNEWRRIYEEALKNNYRFLSYGDSSLLLPR